MPQAVAMVSVRPAEMPAALVPAGLVRAALVRWVPRPGEVDVVIALRRLPTAWPVPGVTVVASSGGPAAGPRRYARYMTTSPPTTDRPVRERWRAQWTELFSEVVTSGLCTGYDADNGVYKPYHLEEEGGPGGCSHGERGCTSCTRACPRFRNWETETDTY